MSDYKTRMADEYRQLVDRSEKLRTMLSKQADGTLGFEPTCPIGLLRHQLDVMDEYADILRQRAEIEHVELGGCRRSDADIAIGVLNKLIAQELETASAGARFGNRIIEESASIRYHAYIAARDKIQAALAEGGAE